MSPVLIEIDRFLKLVDCVTYNILNPIRSCQMPTEIANKTPA
jgi:hypothetical protein